MKRKEERVIVIEEENAGTKFFGANFLYLFGDRRMITVACTIILELERAWAQAQKPGTRF